MIRVDTARARPGISGIAGGMLLRAWNSPTITTWGSIAARAMGLTLVLPLVLSRFTVEETAVWYLLSTIIGIQLIADAGFAPTFARMIAYALGGAKELGDLREAPASNGERTPNWALVERIWSTAGTVYTRLSVAGVLLIGPLATWALIKPVLALANPIEGWTAWLVVVSVSALTLWGNGYAAYLQGVNEIAVLRRWEAITSLAGMLTSFTVLLLGGRLLPLVIATQCWAAISVFRNWRICHAVADRRFGAFRRMGADRDVLNAVWPRAWRSGLGIGMSRGVMYASGLVYAQFASSAAVASYLLAFRLMQAVSEFSQAPFYSKLPVLARLRSEGRIGDQLRLAQHGMNAAYWTFVVGFVGIGVMAEPLTHLIGSNVTFVSPLLWGLMGVAFLAERYGAMHIQLYSTTNHIIWHIANGVSGVLNVLGMVVLIPIVGVYAFPAALLISLVGFYCWYSAIHVYRTYQIGLSFERKTVLAPAIGVLLYLVYALR